MKATIRGSEIYFDIAGMQLVPEHKDWIERPVLFLLHGGPGGNHLNYKLHTLELQEVAQLVFIDNRGSGWSKKTKKSHYTLENNIEDIEALRKYLGLKRISILGTSYGGMVAQGYAIRYSKNIDKLILVATAPSYRMLEDAKNNLQKYGNAKQIAICERYLWQGKFKSDKEFERYFKIMDPLYSVNKKRKLKNPFRGKNIISYEVLNAGFGGFLRHFDFIPKLKKITCPTLILAGEKDWVCDCKHSRVIAKHIPHAQLKIFKNCGHAVARDAHDQYIKIVKNFLKQKS